MSNKLINEKNTRLRYVRALEKFTRSNVSYLKDKNFNFEVFQKRVKKTFEILEKVTTIRLDSTYPIALEIYVNLILKVLHVEEDLNEKEKQGIKEVLLKEANLLHKEKNKNTYKKDKHKHKKFNDEY